MLRWLYLVAFFTAAFHAIGAAAPNILLIVADDLGYSDLGCYGGEIRTPNLDRLARGGVRLTQFHTTARCCPSRASLLTGHYPHRVGLGHMTQDIGHAGYRGRVDENAPTIAEVLRSASFRSFLSGKWHLGTNDPTQHGFEQFYGTLVSAKTFWDRDHYIQIPESADTSSLGGDPFYATDALTDRALQYLNLARQTPERPWFVYLAYNAPHFPLQARSEDIAKYADTYSVGWDLIRQRRLARMKKLGVMPAETELSAPSPYWNYGETKTGTNPDWDSLPADRRADLSRRMAIFAAMIDRMDTGIGRITSDLTAHDELDDTLVIFLSDNGACAEWDPFGFDILSSNQNILHRSDLLESMGGPGTFHSAGSGWASASNTPFRLYKHFCHQGGVLSPCIIHWPRGIRQTAGSICATPAHLIDVMPTVLEVASVDYPTKFAGESTDKLLGVSLIDQINRGPTDDTLRTIFLEHEGNRGVRRGKWKLVALKDAPWELYDVSLDPVEADDLAGKHPGVVRRLANLWDEWADQNDVTPLPDDYNVKYLKPREAKQ